jgi:8-oxo-dGTP diphosphatase
MQTEEQAIIQVTAGIIRKNGKILIAKRPNHGNGGKYEFPGGKLEPGETLEDCLKRELNEEFDVDSKIGSFITKSSFVYGDKSYCLHAYYVDEILGNPKLTVHDEIKWVAYNDLKDYEFMPADIPIVHEIVNMNSH